MGNRSALITSLILAVALLVPEAEAGIIRDLVDAVWFIIDYSVTSVESIITEILNPPRNSNNSIGYALYTLDSPKEPCFLEEDDEALARCPFNSTYPLKFLIHGFMKDSPSLLPMKDPLLEKYKCNIIVVDWTRYGQPPYSLAAINTLLVGHKLANLIQFLVKSKGVDPKNIHLIGHSLGAHVSGVAGKQTSNLGRISGLDPAALKFSSLSLLHRLTYTDADFVDVVHTSTSLLGFGIADPIGHQDFYPNGGFEQPQCVTNQDSETSRQDETFRHLDENLGTKSIINDEICDHSSSIDYFLGNINASECIFLSVMCDSYKDFQAGVCSNGSKPLAVMGLQAKPIPGVGPAAKFYLRTIASKPYCLVDGYKPEEFHQPSPTSGI